MQGLNEIIREVTELPVEERILVVDALLRSLNVPNPEIDNAWAREALLRLEEIRSGKVVPVPGEEVFARVNKRFAR